MKLEKSTFNHNTRVKFTQNILGNFKKQNTLNLLSNIQFITPESNGQKNKSTVSAPRHEIKISVTFWNIMQILKWLNFFILNSTNKQFCGIIYLFIFFWKGLCINVIMRCFKIILRRNSLFIHFIILIRYFHLTHLKRTLHMTVQGN